MSLRRWAAALLLAPSVLVIGVFMAIPMVVALAYSFMTADTYGGVRWPLSTAAYIQLLYERDFDDTLVFTSAYALIIFRSLVLAFATAGLCLVMGLPVAWYIVCRPPSRRQLLIFLVTLPFWINTLIRTYCWVLILRDEGLVNLGLRGTGVTSGSIQFLYNDVAVLLGLVYTFLPFMVLPIFSTLERIDPAVVEASTISMPVAGAASGTSSGHWRARVRSPGRFWCSRRRSAPSLRRISSAAAESC